MHCAVTMHEYWIVKSLLEAGAAPNVQDVRGATPLQIAAGAKKCDRDMCQLLSGYEAASF